MKTLVRFLLGFVIMLPFALLFHLESFFIGRKKAAGKTGRWLTTFSAWFISSTIPEWKAGNSFPDFRKGIIRNFAAFKIVYDIEVHSESESHVEFRINNCPFTTALTQYGCTILCKYACAGDFVVAKKHRGKWKFSRTHSHGTNSNCCNPRYMQAEKPEGS